MRRLVSTVCMIAALLLIAASMDMNYAFWSEQGADERTGRVLGAVSIGIDGFKAALPLIIAWAWVQRFRLGCLIGTSFLCGCLAFSFASALGFAGSARGAVNEIRETLSLRHLAAEKDLKDVNERIEALGTNRPPAVVDEAIGKLRQDRRWSSSYECRDATVEGSRIFCRGLGDLRMELQASLESERLRQRSESLKAEINEARVTHLDGGKAYCRVAGSGSIEKTIGVGEGRAQGAGQSYCDYGTDQVDAMSTTA